MMRYPRSLLLALAALLVPAAAIANPPPIPPPASVSPAVWQTVNQYQGWSVISDRPIQTFTTSGSADKRTTRPSEVSTFNVVAIRVGYENNYVNSTAETPMLNPIVVGATFQNFNVPVASATGAAVNENSSTTVNIPFSFNGAETMVVSPHRWGMSDPLYVPVYAGARNFTRTAVMVPFAAAPAAPTAVASAGAGIAAGTYAVGYSVVYPGGLETPGSTGTSVTTAAGNLQITITSPLASSFPGAFGYRPLISVSGQTTPLYDAGVGPVAFGTNTVLTALSNAAVSSTARQYSNGLSAVIPIGGETLGGTGPGSANNGEYVNAGAFRLNDGWANGGSVATANYGPFVVLGLDPAKVHNSYAFFGDSIGRGLLDGFAGTQWGGAFVRAALNQSAKLYYDATVAPRIGYLQLSVSGETSAQAIGANGETTRAKAALATDIASNLCTNDFAGATTAIQCIASQITLGLNYTPVGKHFHQTTLFSRTASTDGWTTVANQSQPQATISYLFECTRRQFNGTLRSTAVATSAVSGEAMCRQATTDTPATNFYSGGDGSSVYFTTQEPFVTGTETIQVNGVTKVLTTDYSYTGTAVIGGVTYASGVQFTSGAPGGGLPVTASFTASPGFVALYAAAETTAIGRATSLVDVYDWVKNVECNAAGTITLNGGWWCAGSVSATGTSTGSNTSSTLNDTGQTWTQDQWRGYAVLITADSTAPSAVGQNVTILSNTPTTLNTGSWTVTPDGNAHYSITTSYASDGAHLTSWGYSRAAQDIDAQVAARVN